MRAALVALGLLAGCGSSGAGEGLRLAAASSLSPVLPRVLEDFRAETGIPVQAIFGGSGRLAAQARHGAPFDAVWFAGPGPLRAVEEAGLLRPGTRRDLLANALVLVLPAAAGQPPAGLASLAEALEGRGRVAVGAEGVPAGDYARAWLGSQGLLDGGAPGAGVELVQFPNVRAVLAAVQGGACGAAFVYASDARAPGVVTWLRAGPEDCGPIRYPAAVLAGSRRPEAAEALLDFLEEWQAEFEAEGFQPLPAEARG